MKIISMGLILAAFGLASCQNTQNQSGQQPAEGDSTNRVVETMMSRRSIRAYKPEQVKDEELKTIMDCAVNAPSAMNKQSWEVRVIQNPELLQAIAGLSERNLFYNAPTLIVIAAEENNRYSPVDCGLLGENILLAAESMNIGTCVIAGVIDALNSPAALEAILPKLNLPATHKPLYTIALGYKNESPEAKPRDSAKVQVIK
jgi:nitroreductase